MDEIAEVLEWRAGREKMLADMGKVFDAAIEREERICLFQKMYNESQWYLGEERTRREGLEAALTAVTDQCQSLRGELDQSRTEFLQQQKELELVRWQLGEEKSKRLEPCTV